MDIAEMKIEVIERILKLKDKYAIEKILDHLTKLSLEDEFQFDVEVFFKMSVEKHGEVLQKLAT